MRADLVVYLLLPRRLAMARVVRRTVVRREELWNGNVEGPLWTFFADRDHIIRWAWRTHSRNRERLADIQQLRPDLPVVVLRTRAEVRGWLRGPLAGIG